MYLPGERGKMRAADADRDRVVGFLNTAYTEGRLSKDEYDARLDSALSARTYADLDEVVTGLPVAPATVVTPAANTNATVSCAPSPLAGGRERCAVISSASTWLDHDAADPVMPAVMMEAMRESARDPALRERIAAAGAPIPAAPGRADQRRAAARHHPH